MYEIKKMLSGSLSIKTPDIIFSTKKVFIFDLDGTLANLSHRLKFIQGEKKDWDRFFSECINDNPIWNIVEVLQCIKGVPNTEVWVVSGRSSVCAMATVCWLNHYEIPYDRLFMREEGDRRDDYLVKEELLERISPETMSYIRCVFDDRKQVVEMWRRYGFKCCQVAEGDF